MISYFKIVDIELTFTCLYTPEQIMGRVWCTVGGSVTVMLIMVAFFKQNEFK
jgi:hypothetical protein